MTAFIRLTGDLWGSHLEPRRYQVVEVLREADTTWEFKVVGTGDQVWLAFKEPDRGWSAEPISIGINIWDDVIYGDGMPADGDDDVSVTRWTVYEDDPKVGYLTHDIIDSGTLTFTGDPEVDQFVGAEDDWIDSSQAVDFWFAVKAARAIENEHIVEAI